jgi:hypothetical protein
VPEPGSYWDYLSSTESLLLLGPLIPRYMIHFTLRPYRRSLPAAPHRDIAARLNGRHSAASLDTWVDRLLRFYPEVAGYSVKRDSGELAIHYMRLAAALNREYEHRLATGKSLRLDQLLNEPLVSSRLMEWERFTKKHTEDSNVVNFMLGDDVISDYDSYVSITTQPGFATDPDLQIQSIRLDSGGYLMRLARLIDMFNGRQAGPGAPKEYFNLGVAAKFADELADLAIDRSEGRYNLVLALLNKHPDEHSLVTARLECALPIPVGWWLEFAPQTFKEFSVMFQSYYDGLRSRELRRICDASMLRARRGPKLRQSARAWQHVSEPPSQPWR